MAKTAQKPTSGDEPPNIECKVETSAKAGWDCCQLKQFCAKVTELNNLAKESKLKDIRGTQKYADNRRLGDIAAADFRKQWNSNPRRKQNPTKSKFYHDCAVKKGKIGPEFEPDHVHEIQRGGPPSDFANLRWLDESVNTSIQGHVAGLPYNPSYVKADCCPAGASYCRDKGDRASVLT
jgi:hypothetical protein